MLEKINSEELDFCEAYYYPVAIAECLFSDLDNVTAFDEEKFGHVRLGQLALMSFEYMLDEDPNLNEKENFKRREGAGNIWCFGGRKFGKTLFTEIVDIALTIAYNLREHIGFASLDALHIRGILEKLIQALENHPFFRLLKPHINRSPNYRIQLSNGYLLESVNMNIASKNPGAQFFQKHFHRLYIEEGSFETETVYNKRRDSISENGCVMRVSGMTNFTKYSPAGRIFYDLAKRPWVLNLPQYINPKWDSAEKEVATKEYGGENSLSYRVFVKGEVVEEGISVFDMERVRQNYTDRPVKHLEVTKEKFLMKENILVIEKPINASQLFICADIGETAPSEIIILSKVDKLFKYLYNITLYNLTDKEQFAIFKLLIERLSPNFIALDTTEGTGRAIFRSLEEICPKENLCWVSFNEKVPVDFERDERNNILLKDGKPTYREEYVTEWSIKRLKDLLYEGRVQLPLDYKLDIQLNSVISMQSGNRVVYQCINEEDHLFAAFRVFSICQWQNEFALVKPVLTKSFCKTIV